MKIKMKIGDKVRLRSIPPRVHDDREFKTRTLLKKCLGRVFTIQGFQLDGGRFRKRLVEGAWVELEIGEVIKDSTDTIWLEPHCLELVTPTGKKLRAKG